MSLINYCEEPRLSEVTVDGRVFRPVPEWLGKKDNERVLRFIVVADNGMMLWTTDGAKFHHIWTTPEVAKSFGYEVNPDMGHVFEWWIAKSDEGYFLRPSMWVTNFNRKIEKGIPLKRIVAAAWCPRRDDQNFVCSVDNDKYNVRADNLAWQNPREAGVKQFLIDAVTDLRKEVARLNEENAALRSELSLYC